MEAYTPLLNLGFKCKQGRPSLEDKLRLLASYTVTTQKRLAKHGIGESLLNIISHVNGLIPYGAPPQPCSDLFSAYVMFRTAPQRRSLPRVSPSG